jgi:optic atrophy 3 protein
LERIVEIGLRGGWAEFEGTPLTLPRVSVRPVHAQLPSPPHTTDDTSTSGEDS